MLSEEKHSTGRSLSPCPLPAPPPVREEDVAEAIKKLGITVTSHF